MAGRVLPEGDGRRSIGGMSGSRLRLGLVVLLISAAVGLLFVAEDGRLPGAVRDGSARAPEGATAPGPTSEAAAVAAVERDAVDVGDELADGAADEAPPDRIEFTVTVTNETGDVVPGVGVVAEPSDPNETRSLTRAERKGTTDARGRVTLRLFDGPFAIGANRRGTEEGLTNETIYHDVRADAAAATVVLRRKAATVHVVCVDDRDRPLEGVRIRLLPDRIEDRTGADGRVTFEELPVGWHYVYLYPVDGLASPAERTHRLDLAVGARELVRFSLARLGKLRVRLEPPPPPGANAELLTMPRARRWTREEFWVDFDAEGVVELDIAPNRYGLAAMFGSTSRLHQARTVEASVRPGERTEVVVPIRDYEGVLAGRVVDPDGRPVAAARLRVQSAGSEGFK